MKHAAAVPRPRRFAGWLSHPAAFWPALALIGLALFAPLVPLRVVTFALPAGLAGRGRAG